MCCEQERSFLNFRNGSINFNQPCCSRQPALRPSRGSFILWSADNPNPKLNIIQPCTQMCNLQNSGPAVSRQPKPLSSLPAPPRGLKCGATLLFCQAAGQRHSHPAEDIIRIHFYYIVAKINYFITAISFLAYFRLAELVVGRGVLRCVAEASGVKSAA